MLIRWWGWLFFSLLFCAPLSAALYAAPRLSDNALISIEAPSDARHATVVLFLSPKCPCSKAHEPVLRNLTEAFPEARFWGIISGPKQKREAAREHFAKNPLPFPILFDEDYKIANQLGALKTPHAFVLGVQGEVRFHGGVDDARKDPSQAKEQYLAQALEDIREGKQPRRKEVATLGCYIRQ